MSRGSSASARINVEMGTNSGSHAQNILTGSATRASKNSQYEREAKDFNTWSKYALKINNYAKDD